MSFSSTKNNAHNSNNNDNMANSSFDFVLADVNEVLQETPQILTNREQPRDGQHPNEQVLNESTTVRVPKQDSDENPMEVKVTVLRKKLVELAKDEDKPAREEDQNSSSKKNRDGGNTLVSELESLSREDLVNLVRILLVDEAQKQLETTKQETEESVKQAEIVQLERKKAEVHADLRQKLAEIEDMHKEMEEKSEQLAEKAGQINALLVQLIESTSHQHLIPTEQEMKIQLSLETWYDWLALVPRYRLGQIVPLIGDRKFASIVQPFLHEFGDITIDRIQIVAPYEEDPSGCPRVRVWQNNLPLKFEMAETQMPANIRNFNKFELSYFDQSVLTFIQKFQQNGLLDNVNLLSFNKVPSKAIVQPVLCHLLPLINGILSICLPSAQLVDIYDAGSSKEIYELNVKMMEKTRVLNVSCDRQNLDANKIDLYCRWLYQPPRADGKPLLLLIGRLDVDGDMHVDYSPISLFIDRFKQDFLMATNPATFFIRISLPKTFQPLEAICLDNDKTKERFQAKMQENSDKSRLVLQISRHPLASTTKWIMGKEICQKRIYLTKELKVVAI